MDNDTGMEKAAMSPTIRRSPMSLFVHCIAYQSQGQWQAFSCEFGLAAQADTFLAARHKLDAMITDYIHDALVGEDREHARELMSRRGPLSVYAKYYAARAKHWIQSASDGGLRTFCEPMRLAPPSRIQHC
jgi:hypothetical protein